MSDLTAMWNTIAPQLDLDEVDRAFVESKLNDPGLSAEEKRKIVSDFLTDHLAMVDDKIEAATKQATEDLDQELAAAEKEYENTMDELDAEVQQTLAELDGNSGDI